MTNNLIELKNNTPLCIDDKKLALLEYSDVDRYTRILRSKWLNENTLFKFNKIDRKIIVNMLNSCVYGYNNECDLDIPLRFILKDRKNTIYAGVTVADLKNGDIEIAYWTVPRYQNMHIAYACVSNIIQNIFSSCTNFNRVIASIFNDNIASIRLVDKCGFKKVSCDELNNTSKYEVIR